MARFVSTFISSKGKNKELREKQSEIKHIFDNYKYQKFDQMVNSNEFLYYVHQSLTRGSTFVIFAIMCIDVP